MAPATLLFSLFALCSLGSRVQESSKSDTNLPAFVPFNLEHVPKVEGQWYKVPYLPINLAPYSYDHGSVVAAARILALTIPILQEEDFELNSDFGDFILCRCTFDFIRGLQRGMMPADANAFITDPALTAIGTKAAAYYQSPEKALFWHLRTILDPVLAKHQLDKASLSVKKEYFGKCSDCKHVSEVLISDELAMNGVTQKSGDMREEFRGLGVSRLAESLLQCPNRFAAKAKGQHKIKVEGKLVGHPKQIIVHVPSYNTFNSKFLNHFNLTDRQRYKLKAFCIGQTVYRVSPWDSGMLFAYSVNKQWQSSLAHVRAKEVPNKDILLVYEDDSDPSRLLENDVEEDSLCTEELGDLVSPVSRKQIVGPATPTRYQSAKRTYNQFIQRYRNTLSKVVTLPTQTEPFKGPFKIALVGPLASGKTVFARRWFYNWTTDNSDTEEYKATGPVAFYSNKKNMVPPKVIVNMWELSGIWEPICKLHMSDAHAVIIMYDSTDDDSLVQALDLFEKYKEVIKSPLVVLVGSKGDHVLSSTTKVDDKTAARLEALGVHLHYVISSTSPNTDFESVKDEIVSAMQAHYNNRE